MSVDPTTASITWDANGLPISSQFDDVYFSKNSGIDETRFVFLQHNLLPERWQHLKAGDVFTVAETGFGTGLNFLATWQAWQTHAPVAATLHFISVEKYPLTRHDLAQALSLWPELQSLADALLAQYPAVGATGFHRLQFGSVKLTLIYGDAIASYSQLLSVVKPGPRITSHTVGWSPYGTERVVDAWYLDGFAPAKNPDLWTQDLFNLMARLSRPNASFATFTAAGMVKRGLVTAGFEVFKVRGYGTKRDMLHGFFPSAAAMPAGVSSSEPNSTSSLATTNNTSEKDQILDEKTPFDKEIHSFIKADATWHLMPATAIRPKTVAIIGAGLAGCHTAWALAQRGIDVVLLDRSAPAAGASGNPMGVLYTRLSHTQGTLAEFNIQAYLHACRFYRHYGFFEKVGDSCGVLQLPQTPAHLEQLQSIADTYQNSPELAKWLDQAEAETYAGVALTSGGLWFPQAGWLNVAKLCNALATHPQIQVRSQTSVTELQQDENSQWRLRLGDGSVLQADAVVVANAQDALAFSQAAHLPIKKIRGQISLTNTTPSSAQLKTVLCADGYIAPPQNGHHCTGASFVLRSEEQTISWEEHQQNLNNAAALSPAFSDLQVEHLENGRVSFRCTCPDYLPLVGPLSKVDTMVKRFHVYRVNARATVDATGEYWPGLFVNLGHGSRGLAYTPLCAEYLASLIHAEPLPIARDLALALHPARFVIRDLARNKI